MQPPSLENKQFLKHFHSVLSHHVNCILNSRMLLDEDMHLVLTFWNPNVFVKDSEWLRNLLTTSACTTVGLLAAVKLKTLYPLILVTVPIAVRLSQNMKICYSQRKYKRNFEKFLKLIFELYDLNRNILDYYHKRDVAAQACKMPNEAYTILLEPGEKFLKCTTLLLIGILNEIRDSMLKISELVPLSEGDYIYALEWNLEHFKNLDGNDFKELQHQFQKLCDLYVLIVSNFLSCIGLSFCVQLWRETSCCFKNIFNNLIPDMICFLETALNKIKNHFNHIRFTLYNSEDIFRKQRENIKSSKSFIRLQQPLADFLTNVQVTFETAKQLQLLTDQSDPNIDFENLHPFVENIRTQFAVCDDSLNTFVKVFCLLTKQSVIKKADSIPLAVENKESKISAEIRYDDPSEMLEDEEYNLSIHGSEDENFEPRLYDNVDNCSTEYLELMLHELKRKLEERRGGPDKTQDEQTKINIPNESHAVDLGLTKLHLPAVKNPTIEQRPGPPPVPPPMPIVRHDNISSVPAPSMIVEQLPTVDNIHIGLLDAVKSVAQQLNRDEEFQFGFNMFPDLPRPFNTTYRCFSVAMLPGNERQDVERGGKIIMPPSALEQLTRLNINYPMLFKIVNKKTSRITHCGVLEFVADEGKVYLPLWMMHNLVLEEGDLLQIESVSLPVGTFAKFQPLSPEFLDITNPKAVLENCLRTFACLTSGDVIAVKYNQRVYELCVLETQPGNAISIIECDMNVEFAAPVGYKEFEEVKHPEEDMVVDPADLMPEPSGFVAFRGTGNRLDGKRRKDSGSSESTPPKPVYVKGIPDYDYQIGTLRFLRHITKSLESDKEESEEFKAFSGEGFSLKRRI